MKRTAFFLLLLLCYVSSFSQDWISLNSSNLNTLQIYSLYNESSSNKLYIGGRFYKNIGSDFNFITVWNGIYLDSVGNGLHNFPYYIGKYNNELYVGGSFSGINPPYNTSNLVKWNGNSWSDVGINNHGYVRGCFEYNNKLIVYGSFDSVGNIPASKIAVWDGQNWNAFDTTKWEYGGAVFDMEVYQGDIYIAGIFNNQDTSIMNLARWDGTKWYPVGNNTMRNANGVSVLHVYNNLLYVGGSFQKINGCPGDMLVTWDGQHWHEVGTYNLNGTVKSIYELNGYLYIGGYFYTIYNGDTIGSLLRLSVDSLCTCNNIVMSGIEVVSSYNNNIVIGGFFSQIDNDNSINRLAISKGLPKFDNCYSITTSIESLNNKEFSIYPNPTSDFIELTVETDDQELQIFDLQGKMVKRQQLKNSSNSTKVKLDLTTLQNGIYLLRIINSKEVKQTKIIKI